MVYQYIWYCVPSSLVAVLVLIPLALTLRRRLPGTKAEVPAVLLMPNLSVMIFKTLRIVSRTPTMTLYWAKMMYALICFIPVALFPANPWWSEHICRRSRAGQR